MDIIERKIYSLITAILKVLMTVRPVNGIFKQILKPPSFTSAENPLQCSNI